MQSVQTGLWDPHPPSKHASPLPAPPTSSSRHAHVTTAAPAKRITFYKSGDSQFGGVRMAIHKRSFKCFDALLDDLSQKVPLPFGVRTVTTPRGTHTIKHLEQLQDGGCYLCSDRRQAKPINMDLASKRQGIWYHHSRRPQRPEASSGTPPGHLNLPHRQRRILLVKNSEPGMRRSIVLSRRSTRSLRAFLDEVSEVMQFHVRKLYTAEGRRVSIDSVQSLLTCPGVLVCVGREAFSPMSENICLHTFHIHLTSSFFLVFSVNFGLETKKSIIHPRSDSSNRSARFSLSSEKSYGVFSQARPAITNDDIEKRVFVNKDGSLSVEMRVRFRLQNEEIVQWSTQIKKSPSLTNDFCPLSQAQPHYLRPLQRALVENQCQCCYQRHERQFDLWENPTHKHPPAPPVHSSSHAVMRHTHSSSSSSSCNSRRVIRCRARVSGSPGGSGSEQSQLVQKEMCLTEQVEERVEVAQDGNTQVEVCKVSRCCSRTEVVAIDTNIRPPSGKSVEGEVMMGEDEIRPLSAVSSSSHILQSLKEDQDDEEDDLPPSASQCSHRNEPSPTPTPANHLGEGPSSNISACSAQSLKRQEQEENAGNRALSSASSCHCGATNPHSTAEPDETDRVPSSMSQEPKNQASEEVAAAIDNEEINRGLSGLSHNTGLSAGSQKSWTSNVCSNCGGCKRANSAMSAQTGLSAKSKCTTEALLTKSRFKKEGENTAERTTMSNKSSASVKSHKSGCLSVAKEVSLSNQTVAEEGDTDKRAQSSLSMKSNASNKSGKAESVLSNKSDKSKASARSSSSCKQCAKPLTPENKEKDELNGVIEEREESGVEERSASALSATSKLSAKSNKSHRSTEALEKSTSPRSETGEDAEEIATSQMAGRVSVHSTKSCKCNDNGKAPSPVLEVGNNAEEMQPRPESIIEDNLENNNRSTSARSCKSDSSAKSNNAIENRSPSAYSQRSHTSAKSSQSKRSNQPRESQNDPNLTLTETNKEETDIERREALESTMSVKSKSSVKSDVSSKNPSATNAVTIKTPEGADEAKEGEPDSDVACIETSQAGHKEDDLAIKGIYTIDPDGQTLSPKRKPSSRSHSPSSRGSQSPVQKLSLNSGAGEQRGPSSLSVHSKTSSKVSRSRCCCETASPVKKENKEEDRNSEGAQYCSSKRQRKESGCTDRPLSRNSSGSISLGLPEDQETAESDCGKSSVSFCNGERKSPSLHNPPVVDIPIIETPRECEKGDEEGGEQWNERQASATTVQSSRSHKSCCNCSVKSAAQSKGKSSSPNPTSIDKAESVKSAATTNAHKMDTPKSRSSSVMSGTQVCGKSPSERTSNVPISTDAENQNTSRPGSKTKGEEDKTSVHSQSPCGPRPESTASVQSETKRTSEERNMALGSVKSGDHKSHKESECGSTKVSSCRQKETPTSPCSLHSPRPSSKVEPGSGSTLSHSLSAADLLKETLAAARQQDCQSKASKTSDKAHSEKSGRSQRSRSRKDVVEVTPECLPNASPNEVVSNWLRSIPANTSMLTLDNELNDEETEEGAKEMEQTPTEEVGTGEMSPEDEKVELEEKIEPQEEEKKNEAEGDGVGPTLGDTAEISSRSRNWHSSAAVMKVLLSSSLGRCRNMKLYQRKAKIKLDPNEEQSSLPLGSSKATDNPSLSEKSSPNVSSKSPTDNERDTQEDSSSETPPSAPRPPLSKRLSQDPDPVWVLHLLKKLEKQFMSHYIEAMEEFKVRWDLDDSLILDTMISELREEVSRRIQNSIQREMRKIQSRAGKVGRSPWPPQLANMSRDSTMTEKRRRMLKVNTPQIRHEEATGHDVGILLRSDDEYCPCEACVRKKMAARPFKKNPQAAEAPVIMEFDLLKILQLKKSPLPPSSVPKPAEVEPAAADEEGRNLEVVEEEEEEETKEDIKADVVLEETIPEEDEEEEQEKDEESRNKEQEREENSAEDEKLETDEQEETSENAEEEDEGLCTCQSESSKEEEGEAGETNNGTDEGETGTGEEEEEESDRETVKEVTTGDKEEESEDDTSATNGVPTPAEEMMRGNVGASAEEEDEGTGEEEEKQEESEEKEGEASEEERASPQVKDC
uniref:Doublecortin domain-containing protein n=1 Tax=Xiphophorus couchianus TaxID=32473 RepID=A0A3B5MGG7_9TELE